MSAALVLVFFGGVFCRRNLYINILDPLFLLSFREISWAYMIVSMRRDDIIDDGFYNLWRLTFVIWLAAWLVFSELYGAKYKQALRQSIDKFIAKNLTSDIAMKIGIVAMVVYLVASIMIGGGGDQRLVVGKILRPLEGFPEVLTIPILLRCFHLRKRILLVTVFILAFAVGGKSVSLSILGVLSYYCFFLNKKISLTYLLLVPISFGFLIISVIINYKVTFEESIAYIWGRALLDGDVYLYAFSMGGINQIKVDSFWIYIFGPVIKMVGLGEIVPVHIGAQMYSWVNDEDGPYGPNGHLPVLLEALHANYVTTCFDSLVWCFFSIFGAFALARNFKNKSTAWAPSAFFLLTSVRTQCFSDPSYSVVITIQSVLVAITIFSLTKIYTRANSGSLINSWS